MSPAVGKIVMFQVPQQDHKENNGATIAPAIITRVWENNVVNLKVVLDGPGNLWYTSVEQGICERQWSWPAREI